MSGQLIIKTNNTGSQAISLRVPAFHNTIQERGPVEPGHCFDSKTACPGQAEEEL